MELSSDTLTKIVTNQSTEQPPGPPLPEGYELGPFDICNGRGKSNWNVQGNVSFRNFIQQKVRHYINIRSKLEKTQFVNDTVHELRSLGYRFLSEDGNNRYFDIGDAQAKSKVGHSLRDQVAAIRKAVVGHINGGGGGGAAAAAAAEPSSAGESSSSTVPATTTLEQQAGSVDDDDEHRTSTLGKRTIAAVTAAESAHVQALEEEAIAAAATSLDYLYAPTSATEATEATAAAAGTTSAGTESATTTTAPAVQPSSAKKPRRLSEDKVHLAALRTRLTQVIADLQHERRENGRLTEENTNLRKEAEKSRGEFFDLKTQVNNLSTVVRELWSRQGGTLDDLRFLSADAVQVVAQTVGLLPNVPQQQAGDKVGDGQTGDGRTASTENGSVDVLGTEETHDDGAAMENGAVDVSGTEETHDDGLTCDGRTTSMENGSVDVLGTEETHDDRSATVARDVK